MIQHMDISLINGDKQKMVRLPSDKAHTLMVDIMHQGYDYICSEKDSDGTLTVIWPASTTIGKQLPKGEK